LPRDFRLWEEAILELSHQARGICQRLGAFAEKGHKIWNWRYDVDRQHLYKIKEEEIELYMPETNDYQQMRCSNRW
jgi:hypothetical protein